MLEPNFCNQGVIDHRVIMPNDNYTIFAYGSATISLCKEWLGIFTGIYAFLSSKSTGIWKLSQCVPHSLIKQHCFKFCHLIINSYGSYNFWAKIMVQNCYRCSYSCFSVNQCLAWLAVEGRNACKLIDLAKELFFNLFTSISIRN